VSGDEDLDMLADPVAAADQRQVAAANLRTFMRLPVAQRSSIILMDVLGYSLQEVGGITDFTIPAVKAALHRGRARLRELAQEPDDLPPPMLADAERARLAAYVDRFNARDFDAVRDMLADDVKLELVNKMRLKGREVNTYFGRYGEQQSWQFAAGFVDRQPAILVRTSDELPARPAYFILLQWAGAAVAGIRDFRHARYAVEGAEMVEID